MVTPNYKQSNQFAYVDIDRQIYDVVQKHFLSEIKGRFVADDARHYLSAVTQRYDVIVGDTYSHRMSIPTHLLTREYFVAVKRALNEDGYAIFNIIMNPILNDVYSKRVDNTIRSVFLNCVNTPLNYSHNLTNMIYVCKKSLQEKNKMVYTDNLNRSTWDSFKSN